MYEKDLTDIKNYYDKNIDLYLSSYTGDGRYPSNLFRLNIVSELIKKTSGKKILDAGCGNGIFVLYALKNGYDCLGFDISDEMVKRAKDALIEHHFEPERVSTGDIFSLSFPDHSFDKIVVMGVLQHLPDHEKIFGELHRILKPTGNLIVSMDNSLFSLFSMNKYTVEFIRNLLVSYNVPDNIVGDALQKYGELIQVNQALSEKKIIKTSEELNNLGSKMYNYNPLNVTEQLLKVNFQVLDMRFYHFHPLPPRFEKDFPDLFNVLAKSMETTEYDWRGAILCNQFVVRANPVKNP